MWAWIKLILKAWLAFPLVFPGDLLSGDGTVFSAVLLSNLTISHQSICQCILVILHIFHMLALHHIVASTFIVFH